MQPKEAFELNTLPSIVDEMVQQVTRITPPELVVFQQVLTVAEESGEFIGAARRFLGLARRSGTREEMEHEAADVIISTFAAANVLGIDLTQAIADKLEIIFNRGWTERVSP